jgi:hypothetical protein
MTGKPPGSEDVFLVFVEGKPGREAAYATWFAGPHMADMRALAGVRSAHAFRLAGAVGPPPAGLCAIYEFADGPAVLDAIGRSKGTPALPQSDDQGRMTWRLFQTTGAWPPAPLPAEGDVVLALLETPRDAAPPQLADIAAALQAKGARCVRALSLSPSQPSRGSEYGAGLIAVCDAAGGDAPQSLDAMLAHHLPGVAHAVLRAERGLRTPPPASPGRT